MTRLGFDLQVILVIRAMIVPVPGCLFEIALPAIWRSKNAKADRRERASERNTARRHLHHLFL